ncbi:RNA polymerase sigma-54 factor [Oxalobacteraceae bacterium GrIS 2.11]
MKQGLQLRTSQHLALTPQLQQSIRLLQLSTLELHQELEQMLTDNPLLERLDDPMDLAVRLLPDGAINNHAEQPEYSSSTSTENAESGSSGDDAADSNRDDYNDTQQEDSSLWGEANRGSAPDDDEGRPQLEIIEQSLREHLLDQANLSTRTERDAALLSLLIEALDDNGYLDESLEQIHAALPEELGIELDDLQFALNLLQSLDPAGVGARNASECLALQIKRLPHIPLVTRRLALTLVQDFLIQFAQRDFSKIKKALDCDDQDLREAQDVIRQCQPHPGKGFSKDRVDFVAPDVVVIKTKLGWQVQLNQDVMPKLQINSLYANLLRQHKNAATLQTQLQEARWLIKNMRQRFDTILRVSEAIVERQRNFFNHGAVAMRPLVLREIADTLGLHESTISRVTSQKYMLTPHGVFELKYFFGSHVATEAGGEASSTAIRALIKQLIGAEDQTIPLSDSKIANMLGEQGMVIARRTVAKYREALKIPPVNLRKTL